MTTPREQLAEVIYGRLNPTFKNEKWLGTVDGSPNRQSFWAADAILAAGWQPPIPDSPNTLTNN